MINRYIIITNIFLITLYSCRNINSDNLKQENDSNCYKYIYGSYVNKTLLDCISNNSLIIYCKNSCLYKTLLIDSNGFVFQYLTFEKIETTMHDSSLFSADNISFCKLVDSDSNFVLININDTIHEFVKISNQPIKNPLEYYYNINVISGDYILGDSSIVTFCPDGRIDNSMLNFHGVKYYYYQLEIDFLEYEKLNYNLIYLADENNLRREFGFIEKDNKIIIFKTNKHFINRQPEDTIVFELTRLK